MKIFLVCFFTIFNILNSNCSLHLTFPDNPTEDISPRDYIEQKKTFKEGDSLEEFVEYFTNKILPIENDIRERPIHYATQEGYCFFVKDFIKNGEYVNCKNKNGQTPLHIATLFNRLDIIIFLIENGADVNNKDNNLNTPIFYAKEDAFEILLNNGANINLEDKYGANLLHIAAISGSEKTTMSLLNMGAVNFKTSNKYPYTYLFLAVKSKNKNVINMLLETRLKYQLNKDNSSPLHAACFDGSLQLTQLLVYNNIILNIKNDAGMTALHIAALRGYTNIVEFLIQNGALINDQTFLVHKQICLTSRKKGYDLFIGNLNFNKKSDARNNKKTHIITGKTPLHLAAEFGHFDTAYTLLLYGAKIDLKDCTGMTPFLLSIENQNFEISELLAENGANIEEKDNRKRDYKQIFEDKKNYIKNL